MPIIIKKRPTQAPQAPEATQTTPEVSKPVLRPSTALQKPSASKPMAPTVTPSPRPGTVVAKPGPKVIKLGSKDAAQVPAQVQEAPTQAQVKPITHMPPPQKYEPTPIGTRVVITNTMFPWVKHYKPGDIGEVKQIMPNKDPLGISEDGSHQTHLILITEPLDPSRKGQRCALFRWEFETPERLKMEGKQAGVTQQA